MILKLIKSPPLEVTMISPVLTIAEGVKVKNHNKTRIGVGSAVNAKVGELDKIMREGMAKRTRNDVVGCVKSLVGKKKLLLYLYEGKKKDISSFFLVFFISKEEVQMN